MQANFLQESADGRDDLVLQMAARDVFRGGVFTLPRSKKSKEDLSKRSWTDLRMALRKKISGRIHRTPSLPTVEAVARSRSMTDYDEFVSLRPLLSPVATIV